MIEIQLSEEKDFATVSCGYVILKNVKEGLFGPEEHLDRITNGKLSIYNSNRHTKRGNILELDISASTKIDKAILYGLGTMSEINYESLFELYRGTIEHALLNSKKDSIEILTFMHCIGFGFQKKEVFNQFMRAILSILKTNNTSNKLKRVIFNENGAFGKAQIYSYIIDLMFLQSNLFVFKDGSIFLNVNKNKSNTSKTGGSFRDVVIGDISKDELARAIERLKENAGFFSKNELEIVLINSWYSELRKEIIKGVISFEEKAIRQNRIILRILELLDKEGEY